MNRSNTFNYSTNPILSPFLDLFAAESLYLQSGVLHCGTCYDLHFINDRVLHTVHEFVRIEEHLEAPNPMVSHLVFHLWNVHDWWRRSPKSYSPSAEPAAAVDSAHFALLLQGLSPVETKRSCRDLPGYSPTTHIYIYIYTYNNNNNKNNNNIYIYMHYIHIYIYIFACVYIYIRTYNNAYYVNQTQKQIGSEHQKWWPQPIHVVAVSQVNTVTGSMNSSQFLVSVKMTRVKWGLIQEGPSHTLS